MSDDNLDVSKVSRPEQAYSEFHNYSPRPVFPAPLEGYEYSYAGKEDKVDLRKLWSTIRKRGRLIAIVVLALTSVVALSAYKAKPRYQASVTIEMTKDRKAVKSEDALEGNDDLSDTLYMVNIKTKMLGLNSRNLHEDVVSELGLDRYSKFLDVASDNPILAGFKSLLSAVPGQEPAYSQKDLPADVIKEAMSLPDGGDGLRVEERMRLSPYVKVLEDNLTIEPVRDTQAIKASFTHTDPMIAAAVANSIAEKFVQRNFKVRTKRFTSTAGWLERSTDELKKKVEEAEQSLTNYCRDHNILSTGKPDKESLTSTRLTRIHDAATRAETDRMLKGTLYESIKSGGAQLSEASTDPEINSLQKQLHDLQTSAAQLGVKYGPKNPRLIEIQQQIAAVEGQIKSSHEGLEERLKADYDRALQDERSLKAVLATVKAEAVNENQANIRYSLLRQDVDTARSLYTDFLQKTSQAKLRVAEQDKNMRIVESAQVPLSPVGPSRLLIIFVAFIGSLTGGIGLVLLLERLDNTINNIEDVNRYVQLPALGVIPAVARPSRRFFSAKERGIPRLVVGDGPVDDPARRSRAHRRVKAIVLSNRSPVAEAYRVLRTSVLLSSGGSPPQIILITSSQPGEGKTTTVVNTAISLAQVGASVLIIDCDLRTPMVHEMFGLGQGPGLSTYLSSDAQIDALIQKLQIPNLSVLPAGPVPPNPSELISAKKMREMLSALAERYDHILIDSPPLINLADPLQLSTLVDGVILVVYGGKSTRDMVLRAREELLAVGADICGVVLNNADLQRNGINPRHYASYIHESDGQDNAD
jgi:capsular exopolysaccharide synthesis family protein